MAKHSVWVLWIGSIAMMLFGGEGMASVGRWAFGLTFVAHVFEFVLNRSLFERAGGSMGHHFVQTLIYGLFHWAPIKRELEGDSPGA